MSLRKVFLSKNYRPVILLESKDPFPISFYCARETPGLVLGEIIVVFQEWDKYEKLYLEV